MSSMSFGRLFVIAGPSGAGKTSLAHHLVGSFERTLFSVSATTRRPRRDESDGRDYFFLTDTEFDRREREGNFIESALVHGSSYGTPSEWVLEKLMGGENVVLDIDVQGAVQVRETFPGAVLIFVLPPSADVLEKRLVGRSTDTKDVIERRMKEAARETRWLGIFDYFIRNDFIDRAKAGIEALVRAELTSLWNMPFPPEARMLEPDTFSGREYWKGRRILVTAGPTRETIDDVRFISNRSSGLMGYSLAMAFRDAGASVTLVSGPCGGLQPPLMVDLVKVESAAGLASAVTETIPGMDLLAMVAAVSDFRPGRKRDGKIERSPEGLDVHLEPTQDILRSLSLEKTGTRLLAYALEYGPNAEKRAREKMTRKGADAIFLNRGDIENMGMEATGNTGILLFSGGARVEIPPGAKRFVAEATVAALGRHFSGTKPETPE